MSKSTLVKRSTLIAGVASLVSLSSLLSASPSHAAIINGGFETGDFTGWETIGDASIQTSKFGSNPTEGATQALITTAPGLKGFDQPSFSGQNSVPAKSLETFLGLTPGSLNQISNSDVSYSKRKATESSAIKQTFTANAGDVVSFDWNFLTNEDTPEPSFRDFAFVSINSLSKELANVGTSLFNSSGTSFLEETGYQHFSYKLPTAGTYTLGFGTTDVSLVNLNDTTGNSGLLIDHVSLSSTSIPESTSVLGLLALGVFGTGSLLRRKQQQ